MEIDSRVLHKIHKGFHTFARICAVYSLHDVYNSIVIQLAKSLCAFLEEVIFVLVLENDHAHRRV